MKFTKYLILYFKFIVYETYNFLKISDNLFRIKQFGLLNIINNFAFKKVIFPKDENINDYLKKNLSKWEKINFSGNKKKILITGFVHLPLYYMLGALIGKFLEEKYNVKSVCILEKGDYFGELIFRSFNIKNFEYLEKGNFFFKLCQFKKSIEIISRYKNVDQFLNFKFGNIYLGKIVYDHYLRHTGNCSTNIFDFKMYYLLSEALSCDLKFKKILNKNDFKFGVQSEQQFIPGAISFQNCLERNIKIFSRNKGPKWITITRFKNKGEIFTPVDKIDYNFYKYFSKKYKNKPSKLGEEIIKNRLKGKDHFSQKAWGMVNFPKENISIQKLRKIYKWKKNIPIACVFGHLFVDGQYSEGWRLHKDNLTWLQSTLEIIKDIKNVYWIIKPHPLEREYNTSTTTYDEVVKYQKKYNHIKFADKRITNSLLSKNIVATVSSHGTVSLEYASLGIPSVVCGKTKYTKLGFLKEAKTIIEYKKLLKNIYKLKKLKKKHIQKANIWIYLGGKLVLVDSEIMPETIRNQDRLEAYSKSKFWKEASKKIKKFNYKKSYLKKMFFLQIDNKIHNIINYKLLEKEIKKIK